MTIESVHGRPDWYIATNKYSYGIASTREEAIAECLRGVYLIGPEKVDWAIEKVDCKTRKVEWDRSNLSTLPNVIEF